MGDLRHWLSLHRLVSFVYLLDIRGRRRRCGPGTSSHLVICLYILSITTHSPMAVGLPRIGITGRLFCFTLPSISRGFGCLNPCELRSSISSTSCLCSFCYFIVCSFHSRLFRHQRPCFVRISVFSGLYCYWVGPLPFVLVFLDSTFLFSRVGTRACLSITYPSPSFELFFFLFHDAVHTPSPFFPISTSRHLPRPSNSPTPAGFGGWPTPPPVNRPSLFYHCSRHPFPPLWHSTYRSPIELAHLRYLMVRRHPTLPPSNHILYSLSSISPNPPYLAF
jgi:hypothetical protein